MFEGKLNAKGFSFAIIVSRFNDLVTSRLLEGAIDALKKTGADMERVYIFRTPGSFEIPPLAKRLAQSGKFNAIICLSALIRGDTPHFEYLAAEVTKGLAQIAVDHGLPVVYGVITADTLDQALERAGSKMGNKGYEAALTAVEMANLFASAGV